MTKEVILAYLERSTTCYSGQAGNPTTELKNLVDALRRCRARRSRLPHE